MLVQAFTVFLAIIGTTLSCMSTGARVTYAMGKDEELPDHYGMLHKENLTPHRAIWTLATIAAIIGVISVTVAFGDGAAPKDSDIKALPQGIFSSVGYTTHDKMAALPNTLLLMTLASNFGTFLLYGLSCVICIVAFHHHPMYNPVKHLLIPIFGVVANLACMIAYLVWPFMGIGLSRSPYWRWVSRRCGRFMAASTSSASRKKSGRTTLVQRPGTAI